MAERKNISQDDLYLPILERPELSSAEEGVIKWFLSYGRANIMASFILSLPCFYILISGNLRGLSITSLNTQSIFSIVIVGAWIILSLEALVRITPIAVLTLYNLVLGLKPLRRDRWKIAELMGALIFGYDRYFKKKGRPGLPAIIKPEDFLSDKIKHKDQLISSVKSCLDIINSLPPEERKRIKTSLYKGVLEALNRIAAVKDEYKNSRIAESNFLHSLGNEYSLSDRSLTKKETQDMFEWGNRRMDYDGFVSLISKSLLDSESASFSEK